MSQLKHLKLQTHFLLLLLNTSKKQARALFYTLTNEQINVINEIITNLFLLKLTPRINQLFKNYNTLLKRLVKANVKQKRVILENNYLKIYNLLQASKTHLTTLLGDAQC